MNGADSGQDGMLNVAVECEELLGYRIYAGDLESLVERIGTQLAIPAHRGGWLACLNPHSFAVALQDQRFAESLRAANWVIPDGAGILIASRMQGGRIRKRITGADFFDGLSQWLDAKGPFTAMFLGSTSETLTTIRERYAAQYANVANLQTYSPPFSASFDAAEIDHMVSLVNRHRPDVLWVGLTAPKQEKLIAALSLRSDFGFAAAIGAQFDFYAGNVQRSHPVFQQLYLEWLPRLIREPRRLWRRTLVSAPIFLWWSFRAAIRKIASR